MRNTGYKQNKPRSCWSPSPSCPCNSRARPACHVLSLSSSRLWLQPWYFTHGHKRACISNTRPAIVYSCVSNITVNAGSREKVICRSQVKVKIGTHVRAHTQQPCAYWQASWKPGGMTRVEALLSALQTLPQRRACSARTGRSCTQWVTHRATHHGSLSGSRPRLQTAQCTWMCVCVCVCVSKHREWDAIKHYVCAEMIEKQILLGLAISCCIVMPFRLVSCLTQGTHDLSSSMTDTSHHFTDDKRPCNGGVIEVHHKHILFFSHIC